MTRHDAVRILKAKAKLAEIAGRDPERDHSQADQILLEFLEDAGFQDVADAWRDFDDVSGFWYA